MGIGDEIMALGRAEALYQETGNPVSIRGLGGIVREHPAWHHHPAWDKNAEQHIIDGGGFRPYIKEWRGRQAIFNLDHRPRAGRIHLTVEELACATITGPYAIVSPHLKDNASPNKAWGFDRWAEVIKDFPIPVFQLGAGDDRLLPGAQRHITPTFRHAAAVVEKASLVMTNEGGLHHIAAGMGTPAVVIFGAFTPPAVTGYDIHCNMAVETPEGYCGRWEPCNHCKKAMAEITPDMIREKAMQMLRA